MKLKMFCGNATNVEQQYNKWCDDKIVDKILLGMDNNLIALAVWYEETIQDIQKYACTCGTIINLTEVIERNNIKPGDKYAAQCPACLEVYGFVC